MKYLLMLSLLLAAGCASAKVQTRAAGITPEGVQPETVVIADFEAIPNSVGGDMGVYGDGEPNWAKTNTSHSWIYEPKTPGYEVKNVHKGKNSFQLINGEKMMNNNWASFSMNLGPMIDKNANPVIVQPLNVSSYQKLVFWVKGRKGGEKLNVIFRDSHAPDYMPQARVTPFPGGAPSEWTRVEIPFSKISWQVDLKSLVNVGLEFGSNLDNKQWDTFYVDDFTLEK
jgi:hypothetical protein